MAFKLPSIKLFNLGAKKDTALKPEKTWNGKPGRAKYVVSLEQGFTFRTQQDILSWRMALQAAENKVLPRRVLLYRLYDELLLDNHLKGIIEHTIIDAILGEEFSIINRDGSIDEEWTSVFKNQWFEDFIREVINSKLYGHSLIQVTVTEDEEGKPTAKTLLVPRRNVRPETAELLANENDEDGINYIADPSISWCLVEAGRPEDLGLLNNAAAPVIIKKFGITNWSQFAELFGMPLRIATTQSKEPGDLDRLESSLQQMGAAAYAIFQEGEKIDLKESTRSDAFDVYDKLIERCNTEISKLLTGVTLTTDAGNRGARSLGDVHKEILDGVIDSYKRFITYTVKQLFIKLIGQGWDLKDKAFRYNEVKDLEGMWKYSSGLLQYYDIPEDFIEATFGIPVVKREAPIQPMADPKKEKPPKK